MNKLTREITMTGTEKLEAELRTLSDLLEEGKGRFHAVREELRRRHTVKDEQPAPSVVLTPDQALHEQLDREVKVTMGLTNKLIAMEAEQAKLVVEAEIAKAAQREAEDRLALLAKHTATTVSKASVDRLRSALCDVPAGGTSPTNASPWVIQLHRAACEVAGMEVVAKPDKPEQSDLDRFRFGEG